MVLAEMATTEMVPAKTPRQLPVETLTQIIGYLSRPHQLPILEISHMFHDIAVRFLFSTIKIYLLGTEAETWFYKLDSVQSEKAEQTMQTSWEILQHIVQKPRFASSVKIISVVALSDTRSVFETRQALRAIPNLQYFYWFGAFPRLSSSIIACLPPSLRGFHTHSTPSAIAVRHLCQTVRLQLSTAFYYPHTTFDSLGEDAWITEPPDDDAPPIIESMSTTLQNLSLLSWHVGKLSIRVYSSLTELEVCLPLDSDLLGMELVFHHTPLLESLAFVGYITAELFSGLPNHTDALPKLRSFRISCELESLPDITEGQAIALSQFIKKRRNLRKLAIRLAGAQWASISILLPAIHNLSLLEVLGLHAGQTCLQTRDVEVLVSIIGPQLTGLHLAIPWSYPDLANLDVNLLSPLLSRLATLPRLAFLHLFGIGRYLPITPEDLVAEIPHLNMVGLNRTLWDVDKLSSENILREWPPWKTTFAIEDDFQCCDDAWLFKHH